MTNIFLRQGEPAPNDIRLRDPNVADPTGKALLGRSSPQAPGQSWLPLGSALVLLAASVVSAPFVPVDFARASSTRSVPVDQVSRNALLYSEVPFYQNDWRPAKQPQLSVGRVHRVNPLIFSEVPFAQTDWRPVRQPTNSVSRDLQPAPALYTNPVPFSLLDWNYALNASRWLPPTPYPNLVVNSVVVPPPFAQYDWPTTKVVRSATPQAAPYNDNLFTNPIPFAQYDWRSGSAIQGRAPDAVQPWPNFYAIVVSYPFAQYDWPRVSSPKASLPQATSNNPLLLSEVPFAQFDWPRVLPRPLNPPQPQPFNGELYVNLVPFAQFSWPRVQVVRSSPPQATPYNDQLYRNAFPFAQYSWPRVLPVEVLPPPHPTNIAPLSQTFTPSTRVAVTSSEYRVTIVLGGNREAKTTADNRGASAFPKT